MPLPFFRPPRIFPHWKMSETVFDISFEVKAAIREFYMVSDIFQPYKKFLIISIIIKKLEIRGSLCIAPTFLKLDSWSPGAGYIPIISTKGKN